MGEEELGGGLGGDFGEGAKEIWDLGGGKEKMRIWGSILGVRGWIWGGFGGVRMREEDLEGTTWGLGEDFGRDLDRKSVV